MDVLDLVHDDPAAVPGRPIICLYNSLHPDHDDAVREGKIDGSIVCEKRFTRRSDCIRHERIHTNERPYQCEFEGCGKRFVQKSALTVHARIHSGEKPHTCETCGKPFTDSSSLARHRRLHSGNKPYECHVEGCSKSFIRKITLGRHHKSQHPLHPFPLRRAKCRSTSATASSSTTTSRTRKQSRTARSRTASSADAHQDYEDLDGSSDDEDGEDDDDEELSPSISGTTSRMPSGRAEWQATLSPPSSMSLSVSPKPEQSSQSAIGDGNRHFDFRRAPGAAMPSREGHHGIARWQQPPAASAWTPAPVESQQLASKPSVAPYSASSSMIERGANQSRPPVHPTPLLLLHSNHSLRQPHQMPGLAQNVSSLRATAALPSSTSVSPASATFGVHGDARTASWSDEHDRVLPPAGAVWTGPEAPQRYWH